MKFNDLRMYCRHCGNQLNTDSKFCSNCGKSIEHTSNEHHEVNHEVNHEEPIHHAKELSGYYAPSAIRMIILSVLSLGIYQIYWMAKQWGLVNKFTESKSKDTWGKSIFGVFFCYSLFKQVKSIAKGADIEVGYSAGWLATGFIILSFVTHAENEVALLGLLSVVCLIPVNTAMKKYLHKKYGKHERSFLSKGELFSVVIGLLLMLFWAAAEQPY